MTTKHTPGWYIRYDTISALQDHSPTMAAAIDGNAPICDYHENARLIAAAPGLLAALEAAHGYLVMFGTDHGDHIRSVCRAAIAKARDQSTSTDTARATE